MIFSRLFMSEFTELPFVVGLHLTVVCQIDAVSFQSIEPFFSVNIFFFWVYFLEMLRFLRGFPNVPVVLDDYCFLKIQKNTCSYFLNYTNG
jgi:hypothetical protein